MMAKGSSAEIPTVDLDDGWLTVKQTASRFRKTPKTIYRWLGEGKFERKGIKTYRDPAGGIYIQIRPVGAR
jgi:hypothetical protein